MEQSGCSQEALPPAAVAVLPCSDPHSGPFHTQATPWHIRELLGKGPSSGQPDTEKNGFGKWNSIFGQREKGVLECSLSAEAEGTWQGETDRLLLDWAGSIMGPGNCLVEEHRTPTVFKDGHVEDTSLTTVTVGLTSLVPPATP